ncbi:MAG: SET domain-containing protein-lysine N-methyltransferase [Microcoleaceae cyanobacterium]
MIEVKKIPNKGRGIIATKYIPKGTLLEVAPVEVFPFEAKQSINETEVFKYYFVQPSEYGQSKDVKRYLIFGLASLCNHAEKPNVRVEWIENEIGLWSHLIALKDINKSEEITLFYTNIDEYVNADKFL